MNHVSLVGRVARDVKLIESKSGKSMMFLVLAVEGYYNRKEKSMTTDFIPVTLWGKEADKCKKLIKGSLVALQGRVSVGKFPDKETGEIRYATDIIGESVQFLSKPKSKTEGDS